MALNDSRLQAKRRRKASRRAKIRARKAYLYGRYGAGTGELVYRFERLFGNSPVGKKPESLIRAMMESDTMGKKGQERFVSDSTTGDAHRERRRAREAGL